MNLNYKETCLPILDRCRSILMFILIYILHVYIVCKGFIFLNYDIILFLFRFLLNELSSVLSSKISLVQKLPIIKAESRWKTVINSVVSSIKTKKNVRNHKARNQHFPIQNVSNDEVSNRLNIL